MPPTPLLRLPTLPSPLLATKMPPLLPQLTCPSAPAAAAAVGCAATTDLCVTITTATTAAAVASSFLRPCPTRRSSTLTCHDRPGLQVVTTPFRRHHLAFAVAPRLCTSPSNINSSVPWNILRFPHRVICKMTVPSLSRLPEPERDEIC